MSVSQIKQEIKNNDNEDSDSVIAHAAAAVLEWAKKQPAKFITKQAVKVVLIGAGLTAGPAGIVAATIASILIDTKEAY
ncbi:unnamed protein product [Adineta steineri]|uniref:Uncharacterized protein n=1 Tax=Adineta steineri TaxID=433720 RepID=A0A819CWL2_9BILA|nr:unnamed protein product [Adineta steineri]CAF1086526.1 unnamed protein product [Adineta steineri]CAF3802307.1 unnamed protein product [Adineta steineri]CAF3827030.1 unnamed protein product [Adineta steineri]